MAALRDVSAREWIDQYRHLYESTALLSVTHFQRHIRYISLLHQRVLGGVAPFIPVPNSNAGRCLTRSATTTSSLSTSSSENNDPNHLRQTLSSMRMTLCKPFNPMDESRRVYAFSVRETRRILEAAVTSLERVIVTLFLSTRLRIGGLPRLQWREPVDLGLLRATRTVPMTMITLEKGCKVREVRLLPVVRALIARLYREREATASFLFPGAASTSVSAGTHTVRPMTDCPWYIWSICRAIFRCSGVQGDHVHPHTFRHTDRAKETP